MDICGTPTGFTAGRGGAAGRGAGAALVSAGAGLAGAGVGCGTCFGTASVPFGVEA